MCFPMQISDMLADSALALRESLMEYKFTSREAQANHRQWKGSYGLRELRDRLQGRWKVGAIGVMGYSRSGRL